VCSLSLFPPEDVETEPIHREPHEVFLSINRTIRNKLFQEIETLSTAGANVVTNPVEIHPKLKLETLAVCWLPMYLVTFDQHGRRWTRYASGWGSLDTMLEAGDEPYSVFDKMVPNLDRFKNFPSYFWPFLQAGLSRFVSSQNDFLFFLLLTSSSFAFFLQRVDCCILFGVSRAAEGVSSADGFVYRLWSNIESFSRQSFSSYSDFFCSSTF
jgi:hypothetical protein